MHHTGFDMLPFPNVLETSPHPAGSEKIRLKLMAAKVVVAVSCSGQKVKQTHLDICSPLQLQHWCFVRILVIHLQLTRNLPQHLNESLKTWAQSHSGLEPKPDWSSEREARQRKQLTLLVAKALMLGKIVFTQLGSALISFICWFYSVECTGWNHLISSQRTGCYKYYGKWWSLWSQPGLSPVSVGGFVGIVVCMKSSASDTHILFSNLRGSLCFLFFFPPSGCFWKQLLPCGFLE